MVTNVSASGLAENIFLFFAAGTPFFAAGFIKYGGNFVPRTFQADCLSVKGVVALEDACEFFCRPGHRITFFLASVFDVGYNQNNASLL